MKMGLPSRFKYVRSVVDAKSNRFVCLHQNVQISIYVSQARRWKIGAYGGEYILS